MASQQQNPWHNRSKQQSGASRTPQNRSNTASPSPAAQQQRQNTPSQASKPSQPPGNFWAQRANQSRESSHGRSADSAAPQQQQQQQPQRQQSPAITTPATAFNAADVKAFLARGAQEGSFATYKVQEAGGKGGGGGGGVPKGANKYSQTASNQPFFALLAKQIATLEGGG